MSISSADSQMQTPTLGPQFMAGPQGKVPGRKRGRPPVRKLEFQSRYTEPLCQLKVPKKRGRKPGFKLKPRMVMSPLADSPPSSTPEPEMGSIPQDAAIVPHSATPQALTAAEISSSENSQAGPATLICSRQRHQCLMTSCVTPWTPSATPLTPATPPLMSWQHSSHPSMPTFTVAAAAALHQLASADKHPALQPSRRQTEMLTAPWQKLGSVSGPLERTHPAGV
ncbi:uncharacterized protein scml4 isoform X2 [Myripristis murdjan]|uniref:uncharacterized protein scml4 isoform X2 n=1 Tax=Myripristis murdjan TaxID=586833 RepID=UPI0011760EA9|nr:uncharacterized protein LOC115355716 isoform X2 [Myripristis murdjan]